MLYFVESVRLERAVDGRAVRRLRRAFRSLLAILCFSFLCLVAAASRAQTNSAPVLSIGWRSNQLQVSILNAVTGRVYQIQQRSDFKNSTSWTPQILGAPGQTNFM